ncbi:MAG: SWIM zinc finger family protein [Alphaproteobacteria bacterium]|nr:SWIM zinc finger family protein [Alphaproteobacteria bacterium]
MSLSRSAIEAMAPDQSALSAAAKLLKPAKWPSRARSGGLIWGECQGSGANPYRVAADTEDPGSKCTCPSRKFPCKHALALMWMFVEDDAAFRTSDVPDWVKDWLGRRRKGAAPARSGEEKSLNVASRSAVAATIDPETEARRKAAALKRGEGTQRAARAATEDLDVWIADQLRTGIGRFLGDLGDRCRRIAARMMDGKAGALSSRIDEMPSRLLTLPSDERVDAAIGELGKLVVLTRAWRASPDDPELRREVIGAETRDEVLANPDAPRVASLWEVLGERIATRRDGLVSQATWLMNLQPTSPRFAVLLDFFPASAGRRSSAFVAGQRLLAELAFYPARSPLRAVIVSRGDVMDASIPWPAAPPDPLAAYAEHILVAPWQIEVPLLFSDGRICADLAGRAWWRSATSAWAPIGNAVPPLALGASIDRAMGLWDGGRLSLVAAQTNWGRLGFDA